MITAVLLPMLLLGADPITPDELREALAQMPEGDAATELADRLRASIPEGSDLGTGATLIGIGAVAFVIEAPTDSEPAPRLDGMVTRQRGLDLDPIGESGLWAAVVDVPDDEKFNYEFTLDERRFGGGTVAMPGWAAPPEASERPGQPYGMYVELSFRSTVLDNDRTGWIYVPSAYDPSEPAALMVFQDGDAYKREHVGVVVDNLIADGAMPVAILALLNPGVNDDGTPNRSVEYDSLDDRYATFLAEEVLPRLEADYTLRDDPASRAIAGASSGGICAFTVAWQRPDLFGRVCSHIGSFTNIRGGGAYPDLVRGAPKTPIRRIVLQDGRNDLINRFGDWWEANNRMFEALRDAGYDVEFVTDESFHGFQAAGRALPETLRLTWQGWDD